MAERPTTRFVITLMCPDRPGLIHGVSGALLRVGGNIVENAQFVERDSATFCMRTVVDADTDDSGIVAIEPLHLRVRPADRRPRTLVMVSRADHCLVDILYRWNTGTLPVDIPLIVSNHPDCRDHAERHDIAFEHLPVTRDTKEGQEARIAELVDEHRIDLVVLARYMQILGDDLCELLAGRAVNIHHSFLPGFKGARPYHQAHARGVKLVGATAHFVTADLDEGPIIEQDVARVTHAHTPEQLVALGQDTERLVLSRAVRLLAEDRVLLLGDRTVVFDG